MSGLPVLLFFLTSLLLQGCASTRNAKPVREIRNPAVAPAGYYRVQSGDTLYKIAFEQGVDYRDLAAWNKLPDASRIHRGDLLSVRPPKAAVAKPAVRPITTKPVAIKPRVVLAPALEDENTPDFWIWPNQGGLLARYGNGLSKGIDIGGVRGSSIQAAAPGKVVYAGSGLRGYGKLIIIRHGKALLSAYAHVERILVSEGQKVFSGQPIAEMGDTDTDRVKLHFEIREYGKPVDPLNYLPKQS